MWHSRRKAHMMGPFLSRLTRRASMKYASLRKSNQVGYQYNKKCRRLCIHSFFFLSSSFMFIVYGSSTWSGALIKKHDCTLNIKTGVDAIDYAAIQEAEKLLPLELELRKLEELAESYAVIIILKFFFNFVFVCFFRGRCVFISICLP